MQNNKISSHPPSKRPISEFILGAEKKYDVGQNKHQIEIYPWQDASVREDVHKIFTIRLPEELLLKIKFISEKTNKSQQKIVREIISEEINKVISKMI